MPHECIGPPQGSSLTRSEYVIYLCPEGTLVAEDQDFVDHWLIRANALFPKGREISGQW